MVWELENTRIYVQKISGGGKQIIPRLQPLSGGTVFQRFGYETTITRISGIIVGDVDKDALMLMKSTGSAYTLHSPEGNLGDFVVSEVKYDRLPIIYQTMRTDLDCSAPVYTIEMELIPD